MTWPFWLVLLGIAGVAGIALWRFFSDPVKVAGLIEFFASKAFQMAMAEILKPETPEARDKRIQAYREGELPVTKRNPHPNERGGRK